jgi:hypothetical protein
MSARMDSLLDAERLSDIARNDAERDPLARSVESVLNEEWRELQAEMRAEQAPLIAFHVDVIKGGNVVRSFEAMSPSSCEVVMQHADLCEPGSKLSVMRLETWRALQRADERALKSQIERQGATR